WHHQLLNLSHFHKIGCKAFMLVQPVDKNPKIYPRSTKCVLISYACNSKAYCCYYRATNKVVKSFHIHF
ncbi:hypothetical protein IW262DRAFT_1243456, partial [Armillaria fumosa]